MKEVKEDMQDYKKEIVSDDSQNENTTCSKFERVLERYLELINTQDRSLPVITNILLANAKTWSDQLSDFITRVSNLLYSFLRRKYVSAFDHRV